VSARFLHTADWQLGKPFGSVPGDAGAILREARFEAVRRIAALAHEHQVDAVLVAGDVFDSNLASEATLSRALAAMRGFAGPWLLLPGNHDADWRPRPGPGSRRWARPTMSGRSSSPDRFRSPMAEF
jgi:DNA repair exonuclease SbcCD nuclease subunit